MQRILEAFRRWKPRKIGIETNAYQTALTQILDHHGRETREYLPVVAITTVGSKRARVEGSSAFYENGTFRLPVNLPPEVEAQFLHFPKGKNDDAPDVCAMGIEMAREMRPGKIEIVMKRDGVSWGRNDW